MPDIKLLDWQDKMPFGQYKGITVHDVVYIQEDPDYIRWIEQNSWNYGFKPELLDAIKDLETHNRCDWGDFET